MATPLPAAAEAIIDRLTKAKAADPDLDRPRVEAAFAEHFRQLGLEPLPVRWMMDAEAGYRQAWSAARSAAWSAAESAARSAAWSAAWSAAERAAWSAAESAALARQIGIWLPFLDAYEAGLWLFWILADEVIAVPRPVLHVEGERLHCVDGPAVHWPGGAAYYFWRGVQVPADVIVRPETITVEHVLQEANVERRRVLLERFGQARFLREAGATVLHTDRYGTLYHVPLANDEPLTMVRLENSTCEPDGSRKEYWLRVPPTIKTARAAVAWSFDLPVRQYAPIRET